MALLHLSSFTSITFLSSPETADTCHAELEQMLIYHKKVEIDFSGVHVTQGFLQSLLAPLFLKRGMVLFDRLFFANCSEACEKTVQGIINSYKEQNLASQDQVS